MSVDLCGLIGKWGAEQQAESLPVSEKGKRADIRFFRQVVEIIGFDTDGDADGELGGVGVVFVLPPDGIVRIASLAEMPVFAESFQAVAFVVDFGETVQKGEGYWPDLIPLDQPMPKR